MRRCGSDSSKAPSKGKPNRPPKPFVDFPKASRSVCLRKLGGVSGRELAGFVEDYQSKGVDVGCIVFTQAWGSSRNSKNWHFLPDKRCFGGAICMSLTP